MRRSDSKLLICATGGLTKTRLTVMRLMVDTFGRHSPAFGIMKF